MNLDFDAAFGKGSLTVRSATAEVATMSLGSVGSCGTVGDRHAKCSPTVRNGPRLVYIVYSSLILMLLYALTALLRG
jgi:hypothetical protein